MPRKRKVETKILTLTAICAKCEGEVILKREDLGFYGHADECEMCGSHGEVTVSFNCPDCGKYNSVEVASW